jgi:hypothetical protein
MGDIENALVAAPVTKQWTTSSYARHLRGRTGKRSGGRRWKHFMRNMVHIVSFVTFFREAVQQWLQLGSPTEVSSIMFPQEVRLLIQQQNAIGWRQIFRGRFASESDREFRMNITFDISDDLHSSARERGGKRLLFLSSGILGSNCGPYGTKRFMARQRQLELRQSDGR